MDNEQGKQLHFPLNLSLPILSRPGLIMMTYYPTPDSQLWGEREDVDWEGN